MITAVLFDLDDTLFDHHFGSRAALAAVQACHRSFGAMPFDDLEQAHTALLDELHAEVMLGRVPLDVARRERFRRLFAAAGVVAGDDLVQVAAATYRDRYRQVRRAVPGAAALLPLVKARARVGVVSNNLFEEQQDKLRACGLEPWIDTLVVSERAGVSKPDPAIFLLALDRLGCAAHEAVMIGDSWPADIAGARAAGIRAIWFNRHGAAPPERDLTLIELHSLEPAETALKMIFEPARAPRPTATPCA
jgi:HAD superfamily hydrolase (TIGR01509 family)